MVALPGQSRTIHYMSETPVEETPEPAPVDPNPRAFKLVRDSEEVAQGSHFNGRCTIVWPITNEEGVTTYSTVTWDIGSPEDLYPEGLDTQLVWL